VDVGIGRMHEKERNVENVLFGRPQKKELVDRRGQNNEKLKLTLQTLKCFDLAQHRIQWRLFETNTLNQPFLIWGPLMPKGAVD
jgi:hypothetical protein